MPPLTLTKLFTLKNLLGSWTQVQEKFRFAPFRDIIDYRDYHVFINQKVKHIRYEILSIRYRSSHSMKARSQKSKGINRVLTYFHPSDLLVYNLVCQHVHKTSKWRYSRNAFFSRSVHPKKDDLVTTEGDFFFEPYGGTFQEWKKYSTHRAKLGRKRRLNHAVITDIANFFESLHHETIKDVVVPNIKNAEITNLLLLLLGDQILRPKYSAHLRLGIPQDSFDCSRVLANLVLLKTDGYLKYVTKGEWVRWMDDITFCVRSKPEAHRILRDLTERFREDGLSLNPAKTRILQRKELKKHLLLVENALIDKLKEDFRKGRLLSSIRSLQSLWKKLVANRSPAYWEKVVTRILGLAGEARNPFLLPWCYELLIKYPTLHSSVFTYMESLVYRKKIINIIEKYLGSGFDLYEEVRVRLLESLIKLDLPPKDRIKALNMAWTCFQGKDFKDQEYSRAVSLLVIAAYGGKPAYKRLLRIFRGAEPKNLSQSVRRYLIAILLSSETIFCNSVLERAMNETGDLVKDLLLYTMDSKTKKTWDPKTKAAFKPEKRAYSDFKYIPIRKIILLGILTHHPDSAMRTRLLDVVKKDLAWINVKTPRPNCRTDELLFHLLKSRT